MRGGQQRLGERDGRVVVSPRGYKAWAVLAYLVLAERPVARGRLAGLVFGDADDPLGALRWTLAQLRRALGVPDALRGDLLHVALHAVRLRDADRAIERSTGEAR